MELKVVHYVSDEDLKIVASRHFIDNEEVSPEDFTELLVGCIESDEDDEFEDFKECEDCEDDCDECELCDNDDEDDNDDDEDEFEATCDFIAGYADQIVENNLCPQCVFDLLVDLYCEAFNVGARDQRLTTIENLSKEIED
jgi:hypothetical protein